MKQIILILLFSIPTLIYSQEHTSWAEFKKVTYNVEETNCVIKVQNCYKRIYFGDKKLFYIEQNERNSLLFRRKFLKNQKCIKCK